MVQNKEELSVIDFVMVSSNILPYVSRFLIDEQKCYSLMNYSRQNRKSSDHNSLIGCLSIRPQKNKTREESDFQLQESRVNEKFKKLCSDTSVFTDCFNGDQNFQKEAKIWLRALKKLTYRCFKRVSLNGP